MRKIDLSQSEIKLINDCIHFYSEKDSKLPKDYDIKVIRNLRSDINRISSICIKLTSFECAAIIGLLKSVMLEKNTETLKKSDFEIITENNIEKTNIFDKLKLTFILLNKLDSEKRTSFLENLKIKENLNQSDKIYFSESTSGGFYKVGIQMYENKGIRIDRDSFNETFKIVELTKEDYMNSSTPKIFLEKLKKYHRTEKTTDTEKIILKLVEKACV